MKILPIITGNLPFKGRREDRNTASQLTKNNDYSLTENNQKRIEQAIENLSRERGENNIKFLLDTAENLKYGTNIKNGAAPKHDWKMQLKNAAQKSLSMSDPVLKEKYSGEISRIFNQQKPLSEDEKAILASKSFILSHINKSELKNEKNPNIKNIEKNLEHFIVSSEIPIKQKKYILNRFEYLLGPDYQINPDLEGKRTLILAEMLNDIVVNTGTKIPNTKAIHQKSHGMCAAISIARKLLSYEYKQDYVDTILSELDNSDTMMVYDIANIGSGKKVPVQKTYIDFKEAQNKGYRIVDASTMQWMNIADMTGVNNKSTRLYTGFDAEHLGTFQDAHYFAPFEDSSLQAKQSYYQALLTAKDKIDTAKRAKLQKDFDSGEIRKRRESDLNVIKDLNRSLVQKLKESIPNITDAEVNGLKNEILSLELNLSSQIDKIKDDSKKYHFIPNEESSVKKEKIKSFIIDRFPQKADKNLLEKNITDIADIAEMTKSVTESIKPPSTMAGKIRNDRKLFDAAAAYRTGVIMALFDQDLRTDAMIHYDIPDAETVLLENIEKIYEHIEKTGDKSYISHFSSIFGTENDKDTVLNLLSALKSTVFLSLTEQMDSLYAAIGLGGRKADLLTQILSIKEAIENKDKSELKNISISLKIEPDKGKVLKKLDEYEQILKNNPSEKDYAEIFNKLGNKSQLQTFADTFSMISDLVENSDENVESPIIENIKKANNLPQNASKEEIQGKLNEIAEHFNQMSVNISQIRDGMTIEDENNRIINTANPNQLVIRAMEKDGKIIKDTELIPLYIRYNAIDKLRSEDEFASRQGKISDPSLYKYTEQEKETIKKIKKSLNTMAADTNRELNLIFREIKAPLEELARQAGVDSGDYWTPPEAQSGLYSSQQARILQQLTDRYYKVTTDIEKGAEIIKNTPNSGISGSNVFHDRPGGHAMYIAEIANRNGKDIVFHDNTWGAAEHENIWTDSEGLTRTDYSDRRGGPRGYITNEKWRNGNYLKNLANTSGKYTPSPSGLKQLDKLKPKNSFSFPMMSDLIVQGIPDEANNIAASIKDTIFMPDTFFIDDFEDLAKKMTIEEVKSAKIRHQTAIKQYNKEIREIEDRIESTPFKKGISSKEAYDMLADDDLVKVTFEKAAFEKSYDFDSKWKELAKITSTKELEPLKEEQKKTARENFEYAFAKDPKILYAYALNKNKNHITQIINNALEKNGLKATDKQKYNMVLKIAVFENNELKNFDGNLKNTIDFMVNKLLKQFDGIIPDSPAAKNAKEEIKQNLTKDLADALYFNKHDLIKDTDLQAAIKNYIDKKYNPETDEEFVKIYQRLQNMTTEEFRKETADAKYEDMGMKNVSGYDILQKYNAQNGQTTQQIRNLIYQKYLLGAIRLSETTTSYKYKKLQRKISGAYYKGGRTYDDLYNTFNNSLTMLMYKKMFNQNKDDGYRRYRTFPAYPYIDILDNTMLKNKLKHLEERINETTENIRSAKINLYAYEQTDKTEKFLNSLPDNAVLNDSQREILNNMAGDFISANYNDQNIGRSIEAAANMLELADNATAGDFKKAFEPWKTEIGAIKKLSPSENLKNLIKIESLSLKTTVNLITNTDFPKRFKRNVQSALENWINAEIKGSEVYYDKLLENRILEEKISKNSTKNLTEKEKSDFLEQTSIQIHKLKNLRNAAQDNATEAGTMYVNMLNSMILAASELINEENFASFREKINEISSQSAKLSKSEIKNTLIAEIKELNGQSNPGSSNNLDILVNNIYNLKKNLLTKQKLEESASSESKKLENSINGFINKYIEPNAQLALRTKFAEYLKNELASSTKKRVDEAKTDELQNIFEEQYKKYHILNYPTEILDKMTELCAKGGKIDKAPDENAKKLLKTELNIAKSYLDSALSVSALIEIQSQLMEAETLGNASLVASKFKNYDIPTLINSATGMPATMSDDEAVDFMVRSLILTNDDKTAALFIEKLGLTEKFLKVENKLLDVEKQKKNIRKIINILNVTTLQNKAISEEMAKFNEEFDEAEDFEERIEAAKKNIKEKTAKLARKKNITLVLQNLDNALELIKANPDIPKSVIINQALNGALSVISESTNNDLHKFQENLQQLSMICELVEKLNIPDYSPDTKYRDEILKKYDEIINYNDKMLANAAKSSEIITLTDEI